MKKTVLLSLLAMASIVACKKSDKNSSTPVKPISTDSVNLLTDSLKLNHFKTSSKDSALPAPSGSALFQYDRSYDTVFATSGGYAMISTRDNSESEITGYYVKVKGANTYFTLDYTQPVARKKQFHNKVVNARMQRSGNDSSIAIKLPQNILPGNFTVEYEAFDAAGNVSVRNFAIVRVVNNDETSADYKTLMGTWHWGEYGYVSGSGDTSQRHPDNLNVPYADTVFYSCNEDGTIYQDLNGAPYVYSTDTLTHYDVTFSAKSGLSYYYADLYKYLNTTDSRCGSPVYTIDNSTYYTTGKFAYNPSTKELYLIFDDGGVGNNWEYDLYKNVTITANKITLQTNYTTEDGGYYYDLLIK